MARADDRTQYRARVTDNVSVLVLGDRLIFETFGLLTDNGWASSMLHLPITVADQLVVAIGEVLDSAALADAGIAAATGSAVA